MWCAECRRLNIHQWMPLAEIRENLPLRVFKLTRMSQREQTRYNETFESMQGTSWLLYPQRIIYGAQMVSSDADSRMRGTHANLHRISDPHYLDAMPLKCKMGHELILYYAAAVEIWERCNKSGVTNVYLNRRRPSSDGDLALCEIAPTPAELLLTYSSLPHISTN